MSNNKTLHFSDNPYFKINCKNCNRSFDVEFKHMKSKNNLQCPNCELIFNHDALLELKESVIHLEKALEHLYIDINDKFMPIDKNIKSFSISIDWHQDAYKPFNTHDDNFNF